MRLMANDERALDSYFSSFFDDEEADEEYVPIEDWKQVPDRGWQGFNPAFFCLLHLCLITTLQFLFVLLQGSVC